MECSVSVVTSQDLLVQSDLASEYCMLMCAVVSPQRGEFWVLLQERRGEGQAGQS